MLTTPRLGKLTSVLVLVALGLLLAVWGRRSSQSRGDDPMGLRRGSILGNRDGTPGANVP